MPIKIAAVTPKSLCGTHGVVAGDMLTEINGHEVNDALDYGFYSAERSVCLKFSRNAETYRLDFHKPEYEDLGLEFSTFLGDRHKGCKNKCVFCFIDQLPKGLRESLYFKDDDERLSYLLGNYVTLTNLSGHEADRICEMKLSPMNISVHTTEPELRVSMMKNPAAGTSLALLKRFDSAGIKMNFQIVLCPGINDGEHLTRSLSDLLSYENVNSVAVVPVGLTAHREGLAELKPYTREAAAAVLDTIDCFSEKYAPRLGDGIVAAADEFYLIAGRELPPAEYYGDFEQFENGVGMLSRLKDGFYCAAEEHCGKPDDDVKLIVTGEAAFSTISGLVADFNARFGTRHRVKAAKNNLFGGYVTVTALLGGKDIIDACDGESDYDKLLLCSDLLKKDSDLFLDEVTSEQLGQKLKTVVQFVENDGTELFYALAGEDK